MIVMTDCYSFRQVAQDNGFVKGGVGTASPARGSTPAPRPKLGDYSYITLAYQIARDVGFLG
jgi:hypothetical protein